jgi:hypothetical protein
LIYDKINQANIIGLNSFKISVCQQKKETACPILKKMILKICFINQIRQEPVNSDNFIKKIIGETDEIG